MKKIIKIIIVFVWLLLLFYILFDEHENSFYLPSSITLIDYLGITISFLLINLTISKILLQHISFVNKLKRFIKIFIYIIFISVSVLVTPYEDTLLLSTIGIIENATFHIVSQYTEKEMKNNFTISQFLETPVINKKNRKYDFINISFQVTSKDAGTYYIEADYPNNWNKDSPFISVDPNTNKTWEKVTFQQNETKTLLFQMQPTIQFSTLKKNGQYYLNIKITKILKNNPNDTNDPFNTETAYIYFSSDPNDANQSDPELVIIYDKNLVTRLYKYTDFNVPTK